MTKAERTNAFIERYRFTTTPRRGGWAYAGPGETRKAVRAGVRACLRDLGSGEDADAVMADVYTDEWLSRRSGQTLGSLTRDAWDATLSWVVARQP